MGFSLELETRLDTFCSQKLTPLAKDNLYYRKMLKQIKHYWSKLFVSPIEVHNKDGKMLIYPQRTNNILERFFRKFKKTERKKTGTPTLTRKLKSMLANAPLVQNLSNPDYYSAILNGTPTLAARFAQIDAQIVREELQNHKNENVLLSSKLRKLCKVVKLPQKIVKCCSNRLAA